MRFVKKLPNSITELDGVEKCAILLLSLEPESAGTILKQLPKGK